MSKPAPSSPADNSLGSNVKIGDFVEIKKSVIGDDTKISHLGKVAALCRDYDINLLGSIYFSEM